jgi:hypothetical protein
MEVGIQLAKLISSKFSNNLEKIIIINPSNYISFTYEIIKPFLNKKMKSIIELNYNFKSFNEIISNL